MTTTTKKALKELAAMKRATDITDYDFETMRDFLHTHAITTLAISRGVYGMTGALLQDDTTKELFVITARNSALFQAV